MPPNRPARIIGPSREGEPTRRAERAVRPEFGNRLEAAMGARAGALVDSTLDSPLKVRATAGYRGLRQEQRAENHAHDEGSDQLPKHPSTLRTLKFTCFERR
jgi:hypothetical protein